MPKTGEEDENILEDIDNDDPLADIPDEEEEIEDEGKGDDDTKNPSGDGKKSPAPKDGEKPPTPKDKKERWRDRYFKLKEAKIEGVKKPEERFTVQDNQTQEERERAAKVFIMNAVKDVLKEQEASKQDAESEFQERLDVVLEDNPDIKEEEILNVVEEMEDELSGLPPEKVIRAALRIVKAQHEVAGQAKKKPVMPTSKRASPSPVTPRKAAETKGKTMWQVAQDAIQEYRDSKNA